jgi:allophanate hydrolase
LTETVADLVQAHRAKTMSPVETVERTFGRVAAHGDPAIFISLRQQADAPEPAAAAGLAASASLNSACNRSPA